MMRLEQVPPYNRQLEFPVEQPIEASVRRRIRRNLQGVQRAYVSVGGIEAELFGEIQAREQGASCLGLEPSMIGPVPMSWELRVFAIFICKYE